MVAAAGVVGALGVGTDSVVLFNPAAGFAEVVRTVGVGVGVDLVVTIAAPGEVAEGDVVEAETRWVVGTPKVVDVAAPVEVVPEDSVDATEGRAVGRPAVVEVAEAGAPVVLDVACGCWAVVVDGRLVVVCAEDEEAEV